jgi:quercetin dioxygenase-like cupin family protein
MAIPHANSGQPIDIGPLGSGLPDARTVALFKTAELEVMRLVLHAGKSFPSHRVPGEVTIQCLEGKIEVNADGQSHILQTGQLLYLSGNVLHSLLGLEDASALVTIVLGR